MFDCDVHGILFSCIIPHSNFYYVVYFLGLFLLLGYDALTFYNLLWLLHPKVGNLESVLTSCQRRDDKSVDVLDSPRNVAKAQWSRMIYFVHKVIVSFKRNTLYFNFCGLIFFFPLFQKKFEWFCHFHPTFCICYSIYFLNKFF